MTLKTQRNAKFLGHFVAVIKRWVAGAPADRARVTHGHGGKDRRACPGVYALLVGVPHR